MRASVVLMYFLFLSLIGGYSQQQEVPYTLEDRDRMVRLETELKSLKNEISARFEAQDAKLDAQNEKLNGMQILVYFVLGGIFGLMGFILWDRRTFLKPFDDKIKDIEDKNARIINTLKEQAKTNPSLAEILKNTGIY